MITGFQPLLRSGRGGTVADIGLSLTWFNLLTLQFDRPVVKDLVNILVMEDVVLSLFVMVI